MNKVLILTRCTRQDNLQLIHQSIKKTFKDKSLYTWIVLFDLYKIEHIKSNVLRFLSSINTKYIIGESEDDHYTDLLNQAIVSCQSDYVYLLDDDNIIHPDFAQCLKFTDDLVVFGQHRWDWIKYITPEQLNTCNVVGHLDAAQYIISLKKLKSVGGYSGEYTSDGQTVNKILQKGITWRILPETLAYYNHITSFSTSSKPKIGTLLDYQIPDDEYNEYLPSNGPSEISYRQPNLIIHSDDIPKEDLHSLSVLSSLTNDEDLISIFTPVYNIGEVLLRTWESIKNQVYQNWEWVIVNDSEDGGVTQTIVESITNSDPRVKSYTFYNKTRGNIGESKFRAAMLCKGSILVELDHDDELTEDCLFLLKLAFKDYEVGFAYSDAVEMGPNGESLIYPLPFAMGYGKYYDTNNVEGAPQMLVSDTPNINPLTIRALVSCPNHVRAWRKSVYYEIGGHNRNLRIADDFELMIRTFLKTKFIKIPKMLYIQHISGQTSQDAFNNRIDIQHRVAAILKFYNEVIHLRFQELDIEDWAYIPSDSNRTIFELSPVFGINDTANLILTI